MRLLLATFIFLTLATAQAEEAKSVTADAKTEAAASATTEAVPEAAVDKKEETKLTDKKESEIPLNLEAPKKSSEEGHPLFKFMLAISMMGVVGAGAYFFVRKYSKANYAMSKQNQIKVLTQHYLGPKKSLAIIRVSGESILIGITEQNISMIKSLALLDEEVPEATPEAFPGLLQQDTVEISESYRTAESDEEEFSIRDVKNAVSKRLKGMRSLQ